MVRYRVRFNGYYVVQGRKKDVKEEFQQAFEDIFCRTQKNSLSYEIKKEVD